MTRIALVVPGLEEGGGVPVVALFLLRALQDSGRYAPDLISLSTSSSDAESVRVRDPLSWLRGIQTRRGEWEGQRFRHVGARWTEFEFQRYRPRRKLTRLLEEYPLVQVVAGTPAWAYATRRVRRPVALQVATLITEERKRSLSEDHSLLGRWRALMTRITAKYDIKALSSLDAVFVENDWMFEFLRQRMEPSRVIHAPPGVNTELFCPGSRDPERGPYILSVGRFSDPRKRVDLLLEAYHRLTQLVPDPPRLILAGNRPPTLKDWELADKLGIVDHVTFKDNLPTPALAELFRGASFYVLSSDEEGLGIVILEAMASGVPVVSTDCGGPAISVVEGETGFRVPCGDAEKLAGRMADLLRDEDLRQRMGQKARDRAVEHFSLQATAKKFIDYYDRALADAGDVG